MAKIGSGLKSAVSLNENFRFLTSRSSNMILSPFALSSGLSVKIIISELKGGRGTPILSTVYLQTAVLASLPSPGSCDRLVAAGSITECNTGGVGGQRVRLCRLLIVDIYV